MIPKELYKYRAFDEKRLKDAILNTDVYFSCCNQFNDPFDCSLNIKGDVDEQARAEMMKITSSMGIFCLSEVNDDILMWSHYANGHTGVCLEYSTSNSKLFGCEITKIEYAEDYPFFSNRDEINMEWTKKFISTKSKRWEYEKEWRIFYKEHGLQQASNEELTGVILGAAISKEHLNKVVTWTKFRSTPTRIFKTHLSKDQFQIVIEPYEIT